MLIALKITGCDPMERDWLQQLTLISPNLTGICATATGCALRSSPLAPTLPCPFCLG